ncbi:hypothetical protein PV08_01021 [Exophiala spinifera]|uniref:Uncharacterized protein n=1 Tax=Exophiala spinifera TaxID=91928 RepID=A0A0D1YYT6_9EURO|nr:uncharacterized protein PV08_01021 [Exophiala spinifera]KIW20446.1 hypothetical protein PV08_01021 [Exophiala spinifera]
MTGPNVTFTSTRGFVVSVVECTPTPVMNHTSATVASASTNVNVTGTAGDLTAIIPAQGTPTWPNTTTTGCGFPTLETPAGFNVTGGGPATYGDKTTIVLTQTPSIVTVTTVPSSLAATGASRLTTALATPSGWTNEIDSPYGSSVEAGRIAIGTVLAVFGFIVISLGMLGNFGPFGTYTRPMRENLAEWARGHYRQLSLPRFCGGNR